MKHAVLGAGAIGGLIGTAIASLGEDVTLLVRTQKTLSYPRHLSLERADGTITAAAHAVARLTEHVDVLWVATKAYHLQSAIEAVAATPSLIVPLLNGVDHIALLRSRFGQHHVVPATIAVEAERVAEGRFVQRSIVRLTLAASGEPVLAPLLASLQEKLGFICRFVPNEQTLLWSKLCFLAPFALVNTASGKNKAEILSDAGWKAILDSAIAEALAVARASGAIIDDAVVWGILEGLPASTQSSMSKDLVAGRELELDAIAGPIARGGETYGIATPTTKKLMAEISGRARAAHR